MSGDRRRRIVLASAVLFLGGSGLVYEYCLSTLATHLLGNSVEQFSVIIALMLFAMGLAGLAQRSISDPKRVATLFVLVEIALGLLGGASAVLLYLAFGYLEHFRLVLYGLAMAIGFGIGLEIPLLLRLNETWRAELKHNVGEVLALDYIGALAGALIWAFVLLPRFSLDQISVFLGLANLGVAGVTIWAFRGHLQRPVAVVGALVGAVLLLASLSAVAPRWVAEARQHLYADAIRFHTQSIYQDIVVTGRADGQFALYLNGHLQFDSEDEYIYHELLVHPAMAAARSRARVLVLGGGDGLAVREVLRWPDVEQITLVDLDPAITALARGYPPLVALSEGALLDGRVQTRPAQGVSPGPLRPVVKHAERPRDAMQGQAEIVATVRVLNLDADAYLRGLPDTYDVVIADFPDPSAPDLAKLFSVEFYDQVRTHLRPGGVLVAQAGSPYATRRAFWAVHDTLQAAGFEVTSLHAHVPTFGEWGWHVAALGAAPEPVAELPPGLRYVDPATLQATRVFPAPLRRPDGPPAVSTRLDPKVMQRYLAGEPIKSFTTNF